MRRMLGAPLGGTTRGGHKGLESKALCLITPPNFIGGGGSCVPLSVTVALGEPNSPVTCCAMQKDGRSARATPQSTSATKCLTAFISGLPPVFSSDLVFSAANPHAMTARVATLDRRRY